MLGAGSASYAGILRCIGMSLGAMQVMERMRSTLFCLVLPGDSASARRTSEIFMSGCIPVFLGPPFGAMPLADGIDYRGAGLFFNVSEYRCCCCAPCILLCVCTFMSSCRCWGRLHRSGYCCHPKPSRREYCVCMTAAGMMCE